MTRQPKIDRRGWLAWFLQQRRRKHKADLLPPPNAPVIVSGSYGWNLTAGGEADVWIDWTFAHGIYPVAIIEVWVNLYGSYVLQNNVASNLTHYNFPAATDSQQNVYFKLRYVNGGTNGPFSNEYTVVVGP